MIKLAVLGHLGKDVVVNNVNGKQVLNFTVAHSEKYKDRTGTQQEKTIWVDCSWWTDSTAIAQYLNKGQQVYVEGQPESRGFQRNDGSVGSSINVRVRELQLCGSAKNSGNQANDYNNSHPIQNNKKNTGNNATYNADDITEPVDDLPF